MKKIILIVILATIAIAIYSRVSKINLYPSECTETFYLEDTNRISKFDNLKTKLQKSMLSTSSKLVCFLGLDYHFPGLSVEKSKSMIEKYGVILICTGDVTDNNHSKFIKELYNYSAKYNQQILKNK